MAEVNTFTMTGTLTKHPETFSCQDGNIILKSSIAFNKRVYRNGEWIDADPEFYDFEYYTNPNNPQIQMLTKGSRVMAFGHLAQRCFTTKTNVNVRKTYLSVKEIRALSRIQRIPEQEVIEDEEIPF